MSDFQSVRNILNRQFDSRTICHLSFLNYAGNIINERQEYHGSKNCFRLYLTEAKTREQCSNCGLIIKENLHFFKTDEPGEKLCLEDCGFIAALKYRCYFISNIYE